jgi:hypothetical protein
VASIILLQKLDYIKMAASQLARQSTLNEAAYSPMDMQKVEVEGCTLLCDLWRAVTCHLVLETDRLAVFQSIQNVAHPGVHAACRLLTACFVGSCIKKDLTSWCRLPAVPGDQS